MTANDAEAVRQAIYRYARGVDRLDPALVADAFWPDARITLGSIYSGGRDGFVDVAMGFMGMFAATRHDIGNILLAHQAGSIGYEANVRTWHWLRDKGMELTVLGRYIGRAEQRDGEWRLAEHGELMDWGEERSADAGWFEGNAELEKGRRDRDDASYRWLTPPR
jgi:ketosteroid isomerase-like protein